MSFQNRHVGGIIMEPDRIPAVRESACLRLIALQCSWPHAGHPNCYQTCLIIVFGALWVWAVKWAELSVRSASGQQLHHVRLAERWTNKGQSHLVQPPRHPFCYITDVLFFVFVAVVTFQTLNIYVEKELSIIFRLWRQLLSDRKVLLLLLRAEQRDFLQILHHTQNRTNTVTLQCRPLSQLSLI